MIFVDGEFISISAPNSHLKGREIVELLLRNPTLIAASERLKSMPVRRFSISPPWKHVYLLQREYATVDPAIVKLVGTDEATTCVGLVIRNRYTGMTSVSHMDFPGVVDRGLAQMLQNLSDHEAAFDVHLVGAFDDSSTKHVVHSAGSKGNKIQKGYSLPLCCKIVEALQNSREEFHLQTLCILGHNTTTDSYGNAKPIVGGFWVDTSTGLMTPASFDTSSRCPDEIVRRVRISVSSGDPTWDGKLLETYDTHNDRFQIAACSWMPSEWKRRALTLQHLSDTEILFQCSTSPSVEPPDFVENQRRIWNYLIEYPDWSHTFPGRKPRVFERAVDGGWSRCG
uniref:Protein N-terminal asparagine amidohydrolase n=1 Tax=Ananas comosus var. bracteatus TaxID=296719 RepID=A0A6V7PKC7_ANACO|nr:unnamed protein product [Ananas comosus var. bracteatus]